jgi:hypothetical protein
MDPSSINPEFADLVIDERYNPYRACIQGLANEPITVRALLRRADNHLAAEPGYGGLGDYCFVVYADGHVADELIADAMRALRAKQGKVKFLGSYPAAGEHAPAAREEADTRWREADEWVRSLREGIA